MDKIQISDTETIGQESSNSDVFTSFAVSTSPSGQADFAALLVAFVMAELVIPRSAELHAGGVVVVGVALDADAVRHLGPRSVVRQRMPVGAGYQNTRIHSPLDLLMANYDRNRQSDELVNSTFPLYHPRRAFPRASQRIFKNLIFSSLSLSLSFSPSCQSSGSRDAHYITIIIELDGQTDRHDRLIGIPHCGFWIRNRMAIKSRYRSEWLARRDWGKGQGSGLNDAFNKHGD